jgi:molybdopterin-binding protein
MKLSARNILKGKIVELKRGQTTAHVKLDVGGGIVYFVGHDGSAG